MDNKKPWWQSKVLWLNVIAIALEIVKSAADVKELPTVDPAGLAVLNLALRGVTKKGLALR